MKRIYTLALLLLVFGTGRAQTDDVLKTYPPGTKAGDITLISNRSSSNGRQSARIFTIQADKTARYELKAVTALLPGAALQISVDGQATGQSLTAADNGWQELSAGANGKTSPLLITAGKHELKFTMDGPMVPMLDDIFFQTDPGFSSFDARWQEVKQAIDKSLKSTPASFAPLPKGRAYESNLVLSNPEGIYDNDVDASFSYTTFSLINLTAGTTVTFATSSSTVDPVLSLFLLTNIDQYSWSNDDYAGYESRLQVTIPVTGLYALVARPYWNAASGTTNITKDGVAYLSNTVLGGLRYYNATRTGDLNFFTCRLTAGDTRMFVNNYGGTPFMGYNDDYSTSGNWGWGACSRIKKNFANNVSNSFVYAYSIMSSGKADVYMGCPNSEVNKNNNYEFPSLQPDDAIKTGMYSDNYNCTSWAGGVTSSFIWPPEWSSTYSCSGNATLLDCFDNFYANSPAARYPGAWNYTRSGATSANNTIDLWKLGSTYTHASVRKPGNSHPHGYDWESKPGHLARTLHPRNALNGNGYGAVSDYYKATGTYASFANGPQQAFSTDKEAVAAGVAVYENAKLSTRAINKLSSLMADIDKASINQFTVLYEAWKKTWEQNAIYSDPEMYRKNEAYAALDKFCKSNYNRVYLVFDKYVNGDLYIGKILWEMTKGRYSKLLEEAKNDMLNNPVDEQGRYKIHGDIDNGIRYVEKILNSTDALPVETAAGTDISITISPNPVKDMIYVQVNSNASHRIRIEVMAPNTGKTILLQPEKEFAAGQYRFSGNINGLGLSNGELLAIKVLADGKEKTMKAIVIR